MSNGPKLLGCCLVALYALAVGPGCGGKSLRSTVPAEPAVLVEVANHNWYDMVVYARRGTMRRRLGLVNPSQTATFTVPRVLTIGAGTLQLEADPVGTHDVHRPDALLVRPGSVVEWTIAASPSLSRLSVR